LGRVFFFPEENLFNPLGKVFFLLGGECDRSLRRLFTPGETILSFAGRVFAIPRGGYPDSLGRVLFSLST